MNPLEGGRGPTISMCTISKRASGVKNVARGVIVCLCILALWHSRHDCAHLRTSVLMLGHTYRAVMRRSVARTPGCEREWSLSNTTRLSDAGTTGRGTPVERSQMSVVAEAGIGALLS